MLEADNALASLRVLVVHEWLYTWAGSERALEEILRVFPQADLLVGIVAPELRRTNAIAERAEETWVGRIPGARSHHRWFLPLHAVAFAMRDTRGYDLVISSSHAFEKAIPARGRTLHVSYCYSPPRYIWDLQPVYEKLGSIPARVALRVAAPVLRTFDRRFAAGVDHFVSISRTVAGRVRQHYGRPSDVVYPPVRPKPIPEQPAPLRAGYLLHLGRLVPYKRVDLAIQAAERLQMKLIVAGEGPERRSLEALAGRCTEFVGAVSEEEAGRLLAGCSAFVFCCEEDFGIAPVEANAHGAPVVYFDRGGAIETMIAGRTGIPCGAQTVDALVAAIEACLGRSWDGAILRENAARFGPERFRSEFAASVRGALEAHPA